MRLDGVINVIRYFQLDAAGVDEIDAVHRAVELGADAALESDNVDCRSLSLDNHLLGGFFNCWDLFCDFFNFLLSGQVCLLPEKPRPHKGRGRVCESSGYAG